jgi:hypothetical protein
MLLFGGGGDDKKTSKAKRSDGPAPEMSLNDPLAPQVIPGPPGGGGLTPPTMPDPDPAPPPRPTATGPRDIRTFLDQAVEVGCRRMTTCTDDPLGQLILRHGQRHHVDGQLARPDVHRLQRLSACDCLTAWPASCPADGADATAAAQT